ncbi:unnamed protein product, partial [marine sediment metagenome]
MGIKQKHLPPKEDLTEKLAAKLVSRIIVKKGGLFLTGEGGGKLSVLAQGDEGEQGDKGTKGDKGDRGVGIQGGRGERGLR